MGRIYRRRKDGPWWGDWTDPNGKRQQRSLRTSDKVVAKERLRGHELAASPASRGRKQRLSEAIGYMIAMLHDKAEPTRDMYREKGRRIAKTMGDPMVHEVTRDTISGYIAKRLDTSDVEHGKASPHTVSKELITIRRALKEAHDRGVLAVMPAFPRFSPRYKPRETWLTPEEFEKVVAELATDRQLWASLAALGGMRSGEVERLEWDMVDLEHGRIRVPGSKTATSRRTVPIAPALKARLEAAYDAERDAPSDRPNAVVDLWPNVRRDLASACARAEVKRVSPNDLRRTFASWLVQQGVPLLTVATLLGHSSTRMVEKVYGKLSKANMDEAIALLPDGRRKP